MKLKDKKVTNKKGRPFSKAVVLSYPEKIHVVKDTNSTVKESLKNTRKISVPKSYSDNLKNYGIKEKRSMDKFINSLNKLFLAVDNLKNASTDIMI